MSKKLYSEPLAWKIAFLLLIHGTMKKVAIEIGVHEKTISHWKKEYPNFIKIIQYVKDRREAYEAERVKAAEEGGYAVSCEEIIALYLAAAKKGNVTAIDRLARIFGTKKMVEATGFKIDVDINHTVNLSMQQIEELVRKRAIEINPNVEQFLEAEGTKSIGYEPEAHDAEEYS